MRRGFGALGFCLIVSISTLMFSDSASSELFVADFNGDGKPDVLVSSATAPEGFVVLINQGESDGKVSFKKVSPDIKSSAMMAALPTMSSSAPDMPKSQFPTASMPASTTTWTPPVPAASNPNTSWQPVSSPVTQPPVQTPAPAPPKPAMLPPPPAPSISSGVPKLKPLGTPMPAQAETPPPTKHVISAEPPTAKAMPAGVRNVALFNYKDKTSGSQFSWLERGIANILKFDVIEVKSIQLVDRERTDVTFDPAWVREAGLTADLYITGEFEEAAERLIVTTWFLTPSMSSVREFKVEGDRADIFSLIEKVGARLKQELSSLN